jgi:hypothetical protein
VSVPSGKLGIQLRICIISAKTFGNLRAEIAPRWGNARRFAGESPRTLPVTKNHFWTNTCAALVYLDTFAPHNYVARVFRGAGSAAVIFNN